jgi:hypothetical protein
MTKDKNVGGPDKYLAYWKSKPQSMAVDSIAVCVFDISELNPVKFSLILRFCLLFCMGVELGRSH